MSVHAELALNGLGHERVAGIQRARLLAAMAEELAERGSGNVTVAHIVDRAGVSRRTFYELFRDREECFLAAFDEAVDRVGERVLAAYGEPDRTHRAVHGVQKTQGTRRAQSWRERVRAGLIALLVFCEEQPAMARLLVVESLAGGPVVLRRRARLLAVLVGVIEEGREAAKDSAGLPSVTGEGLVGAALSIVHGRLVETGPERLDGSPSPAVEGPRMGELVNPLMSMIVLPYLGATAARRERDRPPPDVHPRNGPASANPLHGLHMRLTYRTIRVLLAVAANPGSSNRTIADAAGVSDQGQMSKLLARLHGLALIENTGAGSTRGGPNAWTLTSKGVEVHAAIDT